ncbi:MAG: hypothetical protein GEV06_03540 [Luteitalea sp.]|nr:hypothetical protein [Luteitalea sp.]
MADDGIAVPYNLHLKSLEAVLSGVRRPGDVFAHGAYDTPMPRVEVEGVGVLSFPIPPGQVRKLIRQAVRAPYGRGEDTIVDESVRKVWQVSPDAVRIGGRSWQRAFQHILSTATRGLGCADTKVAAELHKLLVYDKGGFFKTHRDTEKAAGMFGTLVVVLPSTHRGGDLLLRHAGREISVNLSATEVSELTFAAFYADCEHEVRPITSGNRVCLVYNLMQQRTGKHRRTLTAPCYETEVTALATALQDGFAAPDASAKLTWLLEHQYSPAGLSFAGLKGADGARANVLRLAAERAGCAVHLGIVHIEEYGLAELTYDPDAYRRSRWRFYDEEAEENDEDAEGEAFEVIEVSDGWRYVDHWIDPNDRTMDFGKLPLDDGEVLPAGALDNAPPDAQRVTEATGNEGASFERAYHRAALVMWPRERFLDVLLPAGPGAALPYLKEQIAASATANTRSARDSVIAIARRIVDAWEASPDYRVSPGAGTVPRRDEMLHLLSELGNVRLLERFIRGVMTREYDGSENEALAATAPQLGATNVRTLFAHLVRGHMPVAPRACVNVLNRTISHLGRLNAAWTAALDDVAVTIVEALPNLGQAAASRARHGWRRPQKTEPVDGTMVVELMQGLRVLQAPRLRADAAAAITANPAGFRPDTVVVPALERIHTHQRNGFALDPEVARLWAYAAQFLLSRSERPPTPPRDWRQSVKISCRCDDCRALNAFARDPVADVHRFRVRKDRRQHLHQQIERHGLDMTHVTERQGSPQTLVCRKTRRAYERQCEQHEADRASMSSLLRLMRHPRGELAALAARMTAARERTATV